MIFIQIDGFEVKKILISPVDPETGKPEGIDPELQHEFIEMTMPTIKAYAKLLNEALSALARQTWEHVKETLPERLEQMEKMERDYYGKTVGEPIDEKEKKNDGNKDSKF